MRKKHLKILTALALALAVAGSGNIIPTYSGIVMGSTTGVIIGHNDVAGTVVNVIVPMTLGFTLDPMETISVPGNQIADTDYFFVNKTGIPVKVSLDMQFIPGPESGVNLVDDRSLLSKDDDTVTAKDVFFGILGADSLDMGDMTYQNVSEHDAKGMYDVNSDTLVPFSASDYRASVEFVLASAVESMPGESGFDTLASGGRGVAAFQFFAELNTYAPWAAQDISVSCAYTITPLRTGTYNNYTTNGYFTNGGWGVQLSKGPTQQEPLQEDPLQDPQQQQQQQQQQLQLQLPTPFPIQ